MLKAANLAMRRGSKSISQDDLMFVIRHDASKLRRLREFINWKDVRKNVKTEDATAASLTAAVPLDIELEEEDEAGDTGSVKGGATKAAAVLAAPAKLGSKKRANYYWDYHAALVAEATEGTVLETGPIDHDELLEDARTESLRRLQEADRVTRNMSKAEYIEYTECRQASFTYKKAKKFRDWLGIPTTVTEYRLSDDVLEIFGFLAAEIVRQVTEGALQFVSVDLSAGGEADVEMPVGLFKAPNQKSAVLPKHVQRYLTDQLLNGAPHANQRIKLY